MEELLNDSPFRGTALLPHGLQVGGYGQCLGQRPPCAPLDDPVVVHEAEQLPREPEVLRHECAAAEECLVPLVAALVRGERLAALEGEVL